MDSNGFDLHLPGAAIRRFYVALVGGTALLLLATALSDLRLTIVANSIGAQLDLKREGNVAVWYSSAVLLMAAAAAFATATRSPAGSDRTEWRRLLSAACALSFLGLSIDETAQLHERAGVQFTQRLGTIPFLTEGGGPTFAWLLVLLPFIVLFIAFVLAAVRRSDLHQRSCRLLLSGLACWIGVLLAEFVEAQLVRWSIDRSLQGVIEEGLELTGATLFLIGFMDWLSAASKEGPAVATRRGRAATGSMAPSCIAPTLREESK